jgi:hypothetical protein
MYPFTQLLSLSLQELSPKHRNTSVHKKLFLIIGSWFLISLQNYLDTPSRLFKPGACGEPAISLHSYTVSLVQWVTHLLPVISDPGSIPRGVLMWNWDSPVSVVLLHWWPRHDWSFWPCLRQSLSRTITRPLCWQCDNPTWSHTALLSRFHANCRSSFWLHNWHSRLLGGSPVESLQSHYIHTRSHWSPVSFLS